MAMNIKNEHTHELARELSELTGQSQTQAVTVALEERIERVRRSRARQGIAEALIAIGRQTAPLLELPPDADHTAWLYDENGPPK
ncbi:type II toxin-antitoxin system VapB family antitoxin [soil metagenome]